MRHRERGSSFAGALLGLALGDAFGAPLEGGILERSLWSFIGRTAEGRRRWTDDTQMALDLAESLIACRTVDQDDVAERFARGYRWSRGYGPGAARILKLIRRGVPWRTANTRVFREGSQQSAFRERLAVARAWCTQGSPSPRDVRTRLGNGIAASDSCVTAIYVALAFLNRPFSDMLGFVADCRGDVDTIGAMAGAIWGARNGDSALPDEKLARLEDAERIRRTALELSRVSGDVAAA